VYSQIDPFDKGPLDVGDGHRLHWEQCGTPSGKPAVGLCFARLVTHYWRHALWLESRCAASTAWPASRRC